MSAWSTYSRAWRRYFEAARLPAQERVTARVLMRAFCMGTLSMWYVALYNLLFLGVQGREFKIASQVGVGVILLVLVELVRRGHGLATGWIMGAFTLALIVQRAWAVGELNAMVCALMLPIITFSFLHAKRSILAYSGISYAVLVAMACWLNASRAADLPAPHYSLDTALISLSVILFHVNLVTRIVMATESESLKRVSRSTVAMKQAKQEAMEQSVEAERARQEIMLTQRAKARYLANMSHELRTPLSTIISYSELLDESLDEIEQAPEHVKRDVSLIKSSGEHLLRRINDILDLSRLEAGKMPQHEEAVRLGDIFAHADRFASERASTDNGPRLRVTWPEDAAHTEVEVLCDELLVTKLIANLLLHLKQDGPVSVFVVPRDGQIDILFKLRFWTIPPDPRQLDRLEPGHLHLLLYRALLETLQLPFSEPNAVDSGPWKITLNTL